MIKPNPLIEQAAKDRHDKCCASNVCADCGSHVSGYNANQSVIDRRPEAAEWNWWLACDNADCPRAYGEGLFQDWPEWVTK